MFESESIWKIKSQGFRKNSLQIISSMTNLRSSFAKDVSLRRCPLLSLHAPDYFVMPPCYVLIFLNN